MLQLNTSSQRWGLEITRSNILTRIEVLNETALLLPLTAQDFANHITSVPLHVYSYHGRDLRQSFYIAWALVVHI